MYPQLRTGVERHPNLFPPLDTSDQRSKTLFPKAVHTLPNNFRQMGNSNSVTFKFINFVGFIPVGDVAIQESNT